MTESGTFNDKYCIASAQQIGGGVNQFTSATVNMGRTSAVDLVLMSLMVTNLASVRHKQASPLTKSGQRNWLRDCIRVDQIIPSSDCFSREIVLMCKSIDGM